MTHRGVISSNRDGGGANVDIGSRTCQRGIARAEVATCSGRIITGDDAQPVRCRARRASTSSMSFISHQPNVTRRRVRASSRADLSSGRITGNCASGIVEEIRCAVPSRPCRNRFATAERSSTSSSGNGTAMSALYVSLTSFMV
jgi:hypothetical protein